MHLPVVQVLKDNIKLLHAGLMLRQMAMHDCNGVAAFASIARDWEPHRNTSKSWYGHLPRLPVPTVAAL